MFHKCEAMQSKPRQKVGERKGRENESLKDGIKKPQLELHSQLDNWHSQKTSHHFSSSSHRLSAVLLLKLLSPLWVTKQGGMFGWLSGKCHFRVHSCHSLGTWILSLRVQWWGVGRGSTAFYLWVANCKSPSCETRAGCSNTCLLIRS